MFTVHSRAGITDALVTHACLGNTEVPLWNSVDGSITKESCRWQEFWTERTATQAHSNIVRTFFHLKCIESSGILPVITWHSTRKKVRTILMRACVLYSCHWCRKTTETPVTWYLDTGFLLAEARSIVTPSKPLRSDPNMKVILVPRCILANEGNFNLGYATHSLCLISLFY